MDLDEEISDIRRCCEEKIEFSKVICNNKSLVIILSYILPFIPIFPFIWSQCNETLYLQKINILILCKSLESLITRDMVYSLYNRLKGTLEKHLNSMAVSESLLCAKCGDLGSVECKVRIELKYTDFKKITICLRFPEKYPSVNILVELKSKTLSSKLLQYLTCLCDEEAKENLDKPQIIPVVKCVAGFLIENPLCVAYDEIANLKKLLSGNTEGSDIKLRQKSSSVSLCAKGGQYFFKTKVTVPKLYPAESISWNDYESNLPLVLVRFLNGQAKEIARKCVEPPLNPPKGAPPFQIRCSLFKTLSFLIEASTDFCIEICPICKEKCLPENPSQIVLNDLDDLYVERVLCGHIYHQGCLKKYMREPPFIKSGKPCPAFKRHARADNLPFAITETMSNQNKKLKTPSTACSIPLYHDRWGLSPKLAEARWASQQARARELEEVKDFLQ